MKKLHLVSRALITSLLCLMLCICIGGCLTTEEYEAIYSDNAEIASSSSCLKIGSLETEVGGNYSWSCSSFSGVYPIKDVNTSASVKLSLKVEEGKFKIVATDGYAVYTLAEGSYDGVLDFTDIPSGAYTLKAVGVEAKFSLKLTY